MKLFRDDKGLLDIEEMDIVLDKYGHMSFDESSQEDFNEFCALVIMEAGDKGKKVLYVSENPSVTLMQYLTLAGDKYKRTFSLNFTSVNISGFIDMIDTIKDTYPVVLINGKVDDSVLKELKDLKVVVRD